MVTNGTKKVILNKIVNLRHVVIRNISMQTQRQRPIDSTYHAQKKLEAV